MSSAAQAADTLVYIGTYTGKVSKGIYVMKLDPTTGKLSTPELAAETTNPSFISIAPNGKLLVAVGEMSNFNGKKAGSVSAFSLDATTGKLSALNQQPSGGQGPCFVSIDKAGKNALVANYGSGSVEVVPIKADGTLGEPTSVIQHTGKGTDPKRQAGPHAHSINLDSANRFALACDLGLDRVFAYDFDGAAGTIKAGSAPGGKVAPGAGPRHLAWHPSGKYAFVINEMASTLTSFSYDAATGSLTEVGTVTTLPAPTPGNSTAEVVAHPSGKWVYGSNRGHNSIASFSVDEATGKLSPLGHTPTGGQTPRNFNIDPSGQWLLAANQNSGTVTVLKIDQATGALTATGESAPVGSPVCVKFLVRDGK